MADELQVLRDRVNAVLQQDGNVTETARILGIPRSTLWGQIEKARALGMMPKDAETLPAPRQEFEVTEREEESTVWSVGSSVRTVAQAIEKAEIDLTLWEIVETTVNSFPTSMKLASGDKKEGTYRETPHQEWNWQIKVKLRRKAPKPVQDGIKELLSDLRVELPTIPPGVVTGDHLLELALYDSHFAKLCWKPEVGHDYDLEIAENDYTYAGTDLLNRTAHRGIKEIVLPVGHDFFHVDNWLGTTQRGTLVESTDDRFTKVFRTGCRAIRHLILKCREVAPVRVLWVPGNHDTSTSWYMTEYLRAVFEGDSSVTIQNGEGTKPYRYYLFDKRVLLGYYHGHNIALDKLPLLMATDEPKGWGQSIHRGWRTGDKHKKKSVKFVTASDMFMGVRVDIMPSISGTDRWHLENAFVNNPRVAEAWFWNATVGYVGHESVPSRSQLKQWETV